MPVADRMPLYIVYLLPCPSFSSAGFIHPAVAGIRLNRNGLFRCDIL